jgi:hypothetical protein
MRKKKHILDHYEKSCTKSIQLKQTNIIAIQPDISSEHWKYIINQARQKQRASLLIHPNGRSLCLAYGEKKMIPTEESTKESMRCLMND